MDDRKKYTTPRLRPLGRMQAVTRKSGLHNDHNKWQSRKYFVRRFDE